jgi:hypothetical protein
MVETGVEATVGTSLARKASRMSGKGAPIEAEVDRDLPRRN